MSTKGRMIQALLNLKGILMLTKPLLKKFMTEVKQTIQTLGNPAGELDEIVDNTEKII